MHKNDFLPFVFFSYHSFSLSYLELQIIFPCPRHWTRDRDFGPATATLDPRPRLWTRDRDFGPATISQTRGIKAARAVMVNDLHNDFRYWWISFEAVRNTEIKTRKIMTSFPGPFSRSSSSSYLLSKSYYDLHVPCVQIAKDRRKIDEWDIAMLTY